MHRPPISVSLIGLILGLGTSLVPLTSSAQTSSPTTPPTTSPTPALQPRPIDPTALAADDTAQIDALIDRMEKAVLADDQSAYLACVDPISPEFMMEQRHWAADLSNHRPVVFGIEITSPLEPESFVSAAPGADSVPALRAARATMRMTWKLPKGKSRSVTYTARFLNRDGQWRYAGEAWTSISSADGQNIVRFLDPKLADAADRVVKVMPIVREHVETGFGSSLDHPQVIKLYTSMRHLQQSIYLSYVESLGGWNEPGEAIKILADPKSSENQLKRLLAHEYGHVATFSFDPHASEHMPWWAAEGVAELAAERFTGAKAVQRVDRIVRAWAQTGELADWDKMADFRSTPLSLYSKVYTQSHHFIGWLSEQYSRDARNTWIRELAQGVPLDKATRDAFGSEFEVLDNQWQQSLEKPESAPSQNESPD